MFLHFHLWKAFREYHFVLRGPIQNEENGISCRRNDHFFTTPGKKMEMPVDLRNSMPKRLRNTFSQLCHMHVGSSSKTELVMETFCLHWKLRAYFQRFSLVPPWDLFAFLGKNDWLPFFKYLCRCKT